MAKIKISSKVEQREWEALQAIAYESKQSIAGLLSEAVVAYESKQSIAGLLSEAVADYVRKRRLRPTVLSHLEDSMNENEELGRRLAK
jgi:hypothetical protein